MSNPISPDLFVPICIWVIAALATAGVILRPFHWPEAIWSCTGAALLVLFQFVPLSEALRGAAKGTDVYLFLTGMMLLGALARREGLFDWLAMHAARSAKGSPKRLFALVYGVGILVTIFLSNDATAVILTPAVAAVTKTVCAKKPLPYLFICAFIANAASFVLPVSNPANLVIYGNHMPALGAWLAAHGLSALVAIVATFLMLYWTQRSELKEDLAFDVEAPSLSANGKLAALGIMLSALLLMLASALDWSLGAPTFAAGILTTGGVLLKKHEAPWHLMREISWGILPLVAGLFILVEGLEQTKALEMLFMGLKDLATSSETAAVWLAGCATAAAANLMNNLPAGLIAGTGAETSHVPEKVRSAILIGIDLGPNISVTGSLATLLWLEALRRENLKVDAWTFLRLGVVVTVPALGLSLASLFLLG